jgi:Spy/CpxP family protein refolding chaperone
MNEQFNEKEKFIIPRKKWSNGKKILVTLFIAVFVVVGAAGFNFANQMKKLHDGGPLMMMLNKITDDLNLTADQKTQVQTLKDEIKAKMESRKKDHQSGMDDFGNAFKQDKLDKETLKSIEQKHETDRQDMKEFFMDELVKFHDILTPDQRTQVVQKMQDMRKNHKMDKDKDKMKNN